jgi:hypothetical protein
MKLLKEVQREWGSQGGKKGSAMLTAAERKRKAKKAAAARWRNTGKNDLAGRAPAKKSEG